MNCESCTHQRKDPISFDAHQLDMARMERTIKRLWILLLVLVVLLVGSNALWIWYESQFEDVYTEITQENDRGFNSYIGNDGDINNYGETDDQNETPRP